VKVIVVLVRLLILCEEGDTCEILLTVPLCYRFRPSLHLAYTHRRKVE